MSARINPTMLLLVEYGVTMTAEQFRDRFMPGVMLKTVRNHVARGNLPPMVNGVFDTQAIWQWWEDRCTKTAPRAA
jgi:hypothetical protein